MQIEFLGSIKVEPIHLKNKQKKFLLKNFFACFKAKAVPLLNLNIQDYN